MNWLAAAALNWFRTNKRDMPWRNTKNPYKIWLSEIILQQTRISQGLPYYVKFLKTFPTVRHLALASEDQILTCWQGLGYYSRARNLHETAKKVHFENSGKFPVTASELSKLKGIGNYTAGAMASICFSEPVPAIDGNIYRLTSRLFEIDDPIGSAQGKKVFHDLLLDQIPKKCPGDFNQAMMEIGALICLPQNPKCHDCPFQKKCLAFKNKSQSKFPVKSKKNKAILRPVDFFVIRLNGQIVLEKRGDNDIWKGLYSFPMVNSDFKTKFLTERGINKKNVKQIAKNLKHLLSHQTLVSNLYEIQLSKKLPLENSWIYVDENLLRAYPVSKLMTKFLDNYEIITSAV